MNDDSLLYQRIYELVIAARQNVARGVDLVQVHSNFEIGRHIIEQEQQGEQRASYGKELLSLLADRLTAEFGKGYSRSNIADMRRFYLTYQERARIKGMANNTAFQIIQTASGQSAALFSLSWSHYVFLLGVKNPDERDFYEIEAKNQNWTVRELKRQFDSSLYERLALSRDQDSIRQLAQQGQIISQPKDLLNFDADHFYIDLVFYNRLLRCYVLIDLKIGKLTHQNLGQMQMYVNYFDRYVKTDGENATIGIILCKKKNEALVEITLPEDANIHAREYQLYLPSKEELRQKLQEWAGEEA